MMKLPKFATTATLAALAVGLTACQSSITRDTVASALTDTRGMTVYTFDKDRAGSGISACYGPCAVQWPPVPAGSLGTQESEPVVRRDGVRQATVNQQAFYYFAGDTRPGEQSGDGIGGVWHVAQRSAYSASSGTSSYQAVGGYGGY